MLIDWKRGFEYKLWPRIRGIFNGETWLSELANYPLAEEVELTISCNDEEFQYMPDLPNLRSFQFGGNARLSDASVPRIAQWTTLRRLEMQSDRITATALSHLAPLTELVALDLSYSRATDDWLRHLTALPSLEELDLSNTRVDGSGFASLTGLPRLRRLKIGDTLYEPCVNRLVGCDALEELDYSGDLLGFWIPPLNENTLAPLQRLPKLRVLNLGGGLEEPAGVVLAICRQVPTLQEVHFNGERLI